MGQGFLHGPSARTARLANDGLVLILSSPHVDEPSAVPSLRSNHLMPKRSNQAIWLANTSYLILVLIFIPYFNISFNI